MKIFHVITIFPEMFTSYLDESILKRAIKNKKIKIKFYNPRDFAKDKHNKVDDIPFGGGPGMVMKAEPIIKAWQKAMGQKKRAKTIILSPGGKEFTNQYAKRISEEYKNIIIIAGRYEGVDARVKKITKAEEISIGKYVLTGGELPAMVLIDSISRQSPGVLGNELSVEENRISSGEVYTKPRTITFKKKNYSVPKVLLSGHHQKINEWKGKRRRK